MNVPRRIGDALVTAGLLLVFQGPALHGADYRVPGSQRQAVEGSGSSSSNSSGSGSIWSAIGNAADKAKEKRLAEAFTSNQAGNKAYESGEYAKAVELYKEAAKKSPDDLVIRKNLADAQAKVATGQQSAAKTKADEMARQQAERGAATRMQESLGALAQSLAAETAAPVGSAGGLSFTSTLPVDSSAVDANKAASGLPKGLDDGIAEVFDRAPAGVSDRVRKGYLALMDGDLNVAKAWFQDALNRDPANENLKEFVVAIGSTPQGTRNTSPGTASGGPAAPNAVVPARANTDPLARTVPPSPTSQAEQRTLIEHANEVLQQLNRSLNRRLPAGRQVTLVIAVRG